MQSAVSSVKPLFLKVRYFLQNEIKRDPATYSVIFIIAGVFCGLYLAGRDLQTSSFYNAYRHIVRGYRGDAPQQVYDFTYCVAVGGFVFFLSVGMLLGLLAYREQHYIITVEDASLTYQIRSLIADRAQIEAQLTKLLTANPNINLRNYEESLGIKIVRFDRSGPAAGPSRNITVGN